MDAWLAAHRLGLSLALVVVALLGAGVYLGSRPSERPLLIALPTASSSASAGGPRAYISGEVARPGVYRFEPGDRVEQLVALAGGFTAEANVDALNLALRLRDEQQVHVSRVAPTAAAGAVAPGGVSSESKLIDLNTASAPELETLPGIGPVTAQRIVDQRTKVGPYVKVEDLLTLKLVNSSTFEKIRSLVTVR